MDVSTVFSRGKSSHKKKFWRLPPNSTRKLSVSTNQSVKRISAALAEYGIGVAFVLEIILFAILSPYFLTAENLLNVTLQTSITAIIAVGMTFVILTAGIDLSVGSVVALVGVVTTSILKSGGEGT